MFEGLIYQAPCPAAQNKDPCRFWMGKKRQMNIRPEEITSVLKKEIAGYEKKIRDREKKENLTLDQLDDYGKQEALLKKLVKKSSHKPTWLLSRRMCWPEPSSFANCGVEWCRCRRSWIGVVIACMG